MTDYEFDLLTQYVRRECWNIKGDDELISMWLLKYQPTWIEHQKNNGYLFEPSGLSIVKGLADNIVIVAYNTEEVSKLAYITPTDHEKFIFYFMETDTSTDIYTFFNGEIKHTLDSTNPNTIIIERQ